MPTPPACSLNAAIEAVRASEAGKGFGRGLQVKDLARQTADATEQISTTITAITADCEAVNATIANVEETITESQHVDHRRGAVEEQSVTTTEVNQSLQAAQGVQQITKSITNIASSTQMISLLE